MREHAFCSLHDTWLYSLHHMRLQVKFREHTFLQNRLVPAALRDNRVRVSVAARGEAPPPSTAHAVHLRYGTPMADVRAAVLAANPAARVVQIEAPHLKRLCRWLGSAEKNRAFNAPGRGQSSVTWSE